MRLLDQSAPTAIRPKPSGLLVVGILLIGGMMAPFVLTTIAAPPGEAQQTTRDSETPDQPTSSPAVEKPSVDADDEGLRARLLAEAPQAWSKIIRIADHLEVTREDRVRQGNVDNTLKLAGDNCLIMAAYSNPDGSLQREEVFCRNSRNSFQLTRSSRKAPWVVKNAGKTPHDEIENYLKLWSIDSFSKPQLTLGPAYLPKIFGASSFIIKNVKSLKQGSSALVSLAFEYAPPEAERPRGWLSASGVISLNPDLAWGIEEYRIDVKFSNGITQHQSLHNEFTPAADGVPLFLKSRRGEVQSEGQPTVTLTSKVQKVSTRDIPDKEFTLTAFGLPENASPAPFR